MTGGGEGGGNGAGGGGATDVISRGGGDGFIGVCRWGKDSWGIQTLSSVAAEGLSDGVVGPQERGSAELLIERIQSNFLKKSHLFTLP